MDIFKIINSIKNQEENVNVDKLESTEMDIVNASVELSVFIESTNDVTIKVLSNLTESIGDAVKGGFEKVKKLIITLCNFFKGLFNKALTFFKGLFGGAAVKKFINTRKEIDDVLKKMTSPTGKLDKELKIKEYKNLLTTPNIKSDDELGDLVKVLEGATVSEKFIVFKVDEAEITNMLKNHLKNKGNLTDEKNSELVNKMFGPSFIKAIHNKDKIKDIDLDDRKKENDDFLENMRETEETDMELSKAYIYITNVLKDIIKQPLFAKGKDDNSIKVLDSLIKELNKVIKDADNMGVAFSRILDAAANSLNEENNSKPDDTGKTSDDNKYISLVGKKDDKTKENNGSAIPSSADMSSAATALSSQVASIMSDSQLILAKVIGQVKMDLELDVARGTIISNAAAEYMNIARSNFIKS